MRVPYCWRRRAGVVIEGLEGRRLLSGTTGGTPTFSVSFDDRGGVYSQWYDRVRSTILAAASDWAQYINSSAKIELSVDFDETLTAPTLATAGFDRRVFFRQGPGYQIQIGNVAAELRTGQDQNGSTPDAFISIRPGALGGLYFDATADRSAAAPDDRIDARSVFEHEIGHALGVFGTGGGAHDTPTGNRLVYDQYVTLGGGGEIFFTGPNAQAAYGGPVPLSHDDSSHIGNDDGPGEDLADDLMAPAIPDGAKRTISAVDLGVLADAGVPMKTMAIPAVQAADVTVVRAGGGTGGVATFVVTLSKASGQAVTVPVRTVNGTAVAGRDYVTLDRTVTFAPGETSKTVSVKLLAGSPFDKDKTFTLNFGLPTGAVLLKGDAQATIKNNVLAADAAHAATFTDATGNVITVNLRGAGVATVNRDSSGNLDTVTLKGSNAATVLVVRSKKASVLHGITAAGGLGGIDAPNTDFAGALKLGGTYQVTFRDVLAGSAMTFGASARQLAFVARNVADSTIATAGVMRSFAAQAWRDPDDAGDVLKAASFGTVTVRGEMQGDVASGGTIGTVSAGTLRDATVHAKSSVTTVTVGAAIGSDVLVGTSVFPETMAQFANKKAMLTTFTVRGTGAFSDTRVAAPAIKTATLGRVDVDNGGTVFGVAADSVALVTGSTPAEPKFKRSGLKSPGQSVREGDFVVRVL